MSISKIHIEKNTVQETLIIPLYGRKMCTEQFPDLFQDSRAVELIESLDYDFTAMEKKSKSTFYRFGALEVAMRETDLALEVKDYLKVHPKAAVVNLGCGLDQTGENQDNGTCRMAKEVWTEETGGSNLSDKDRFQRDPFSYRRA